MRHRPVVTDFKVRPVTYPEGHWMNRYWGRLARGVMHLACRIPFYRYVPRLHADAEAVFWSDEPAIFACVHQDMFDCFNGLPRIVRHRPLAAMVSYSRDGGLAAMGLRMLGYEIVRGSSSRGGGEGLLMLHSTLRSGTSVALACDGPKAPLGDVKPGVVRLAAMAGAPILPVRAWGLNRYRFERSWSNLSVSLPFLPVVYCVGAPVRVPPDAADTRPYQLAIAESISRMARFATAWANGPPVSPYKIARA